ncbi:hypothetical protein BDP55DRAFT_756722 [Colletotrichum godetiae]|uniref:Uncharacterized protein n=1 Tax=Colletotrichum godetiae TaxID=1209918 RepID=A0AAJ0ACX5_9PEZI|nr:uncharacterized protein BDP55DRAFT_756722 [Colletotrichum godetiae]KAK1659321.1 hypothetical protein BDP55DRAFT_756722 [Colletotrichum godetiae]
MVQGVKGTWTFQVSRYAAGKFTPNCLPNIHRHPPLRKHQNTSKRSQKHTTPGIRWSSPTQLLIRPSLAYLWESGRDPEFSNGYGRMW